MDCGSGPKRNGWKQRCGEQGFGTFASMMLSRALRTTKIQHGEGALAFTLHVSERAWPGARPSMSTLFAMLNQRTTARAQAALVLNFVGTLEAATFTT